MTRILLTNVLVLMMCTSARGQNADPPPPPTPDAQRGPGGPGGPGGGGGFGGPGGPMGQHVELLKKFGKDGDKKLNAEERKAAREFLAKDGGNRRRGFGGFGRQNQEPGKPGEKLTPADVKT